MSLPVNLPESKSPVPIYPKRVKTPRRKSIIDGQCWRENTPVLSKKFSTKHRVVSALCLECNSSNSPQRNDAKQFNNKDEVCPGKVICVDGRRAIGGKAKGARQWRETVY